MLVNKELYKTWEQLRVKKGSMSPYLTSIGLQNMRGISDLQVSFDYPVSVLAGPNGCGKTTVLQACYCAYRQPKLKGPNRQTPTNIFPSLKSKSVPQVDDDLGHPVLEYQYKNGTQNLTMRWHKPGESWSKNFHGRKGAKQPEREVYLRTLSHLSNPAEVRSILQIGRQLATVSDLDSQQISLAQRLLPFSYLGVKLFEASGRELLIAERDGAQYSELHMSAGERAILHLSKELSQLHSALVLIDEVEIGLHPTLQEQLMLELQRLALRHNLQIIVSSHSTVILDCVPREARIILACDSTGNIVRKEPHRDLVQQSLYGRANEQLSILCEDEIAEHIIWGVLDVLLPELDLRPHNIRFGRDSGKSEFPQHVATLSLAGKLEEFLFVLDGDGRAEGKKMQEKAAEFRQFVEPLFLLGEQAPEEWLYEQLEVETEHYKVELGPHLQQELRYCRQLYESATSRRNEIPKYRWITLSERLGREPEQLARAVAKCSAKDKNNALGKFLLVVQEAIAKWRSGYGEIP